MSYNENNYEPYEYGTNHTDYSTSYQYGGSNGSSYEPEEPKKKSGGKWKTCVALAVVFGVVASVTFQGSNFAVSKLFGTSSGSQQKLSVTDVTTNSSTSITSDITEVAANVMPSVVSITNMSVQEVQNYFFGGTTQYESQSSGSGIIIGQNDTELLVVTNNHVVAGSETLTVTFADEANVQAQIKGTDADKDLAIITVKLSDISSETMEAIKSATLGDSSTLKVGEPTIAIGNALGYGQSVTTGIVSALNRQIERYDGELIQTDAAINPGNSGGALLNAAGEVIGINTAKVSDSSVEGMGYAIPITDVKDILNSLMNRETRQKVAENERGVIGIKGVSVDSQTSQLYGMPQGVHVSEIVEGGGADKAGLQAGSIITGMDGTSIDTMEELQELLTYYKAGETVTFTIQVPSEQGYVEQNIDITLGK